jgi:hypothetical protein
MMSVISSSPFRAAPAGSSRFAFRAKPALPLQGVDLRPGVILATGDVVNAFSAAADIPLNGACGVPFFWTALNL